MSKRTVPGGKRYLGETVKVIQSALKYFKRRFETDMMDSNLVKYLIFNVKYLAKNGKNKTDRVREHSAGGYK